MLTSFFTSRLPQLRESITDAFYVSESQAIQYLLPLLVFSDDFVQSSQELAHQLVVSMREKRACASGVDALMHEFSLSSQEGIALMCLAESLLRIPDRATADRLIRDKLVSGQWQNHVGKSESTFVNFAAWGLLLTGKIVSATPEESTLNSVLQKMIKKGGEPLIRQSMNWAMRFLGQKFVMGETISDALKNSQIRQSKGYLFSYDMLGEAALTTEDANRYYQSYVSAIHAVGKASNGKGVYQASGISVKLSALHPRYQRSQHEAVMQELYPRLKNLMVLAKQYQIGLNIDAEESERLEISLDLIERLLLEPELSDFKGIGVVVQAYQKRCPHVIDYLIELARQTQHHLMVRLVKGAYWDAEIKKSQVEGWPDYPVYTRKSHTDMAYLACAKKLLSAQDVIYPQFATHNAYCVTAIFHLGAGKNYEFQCLHGMGESLYDQIVGKHHFNRLCRIYAPVGSHKTLLAYLVRRLLENGANTSFVNQIVDPNIRIEQLLEDPVQSAKGFHGTPHPNIPLPKDLYGKNRLNSQGINWANERTLLLMNSIETQNKNPQWYARPFLRQMPLEAERPILNPAVKTERIGWVESANLEDIQLALYQANQAQPNWAALSVEARAQCLIKCANLLEVHSDELMLLMIKEAGKTWPNAGSEIREAVDFCRYYAEQARQDTVLRTRCAQGVMVAISPWNFPLAIFLGEIVSALVMGNTVIAKPAEQTALTAAFAIALLYEAGVPREVLHFLPGEGEEVGQALVNAKTINGVIFTGSTSVAKLIEKAQIGQDQPRTLIAETGGINTMIVDSSALPEQVVTDVMTSAFDSAGQRCSALRVLCLQEETADHIIQMLKGAMQCLQLGNPLQLRTDVGPVIDENAQLTIQAYQASLRQKALDFYEIPLSYAHQQGYFVAPSFYVLPNWSLIQKEIFGPVLHIVKYKSQDLDALLDTINALGYGLTMGVHSRIQETIDKIVNKAHVGNLYVNRNMVGAVVGTQPFGGENLSGTGPKAGGPLYLYALSQGQLGPDWKPADTNLLPECWEKIKTVEIDRLTNLSFSDWQSYLSELERTMLSLSVPQKLPSPTGELNQLSWYPRGKIACFAYSPSSLFKQLAHIAISNNTAVIPLAQKDWLPKEWLDMSWIIMTESVTSLDIKGVLHDGSGVDITQIHKKIAQQIKSIIPMIRIKDDYYDIWRLLTERTLTINTTAIGGNATLMAMGG